MKKAFSNSKSKSKTFVRRVLSKTSNTSLNTSENDKNRSKDSEDNFMEERKEGNGAKPPMDIEAELLQLKKQITNLEKTVNCMQNDNEKKEAALGKLARDKERLHVDLNKQKRSNSNLKQQLDDERSFYYKEKEQYCIEMNETKKLKQKLHQVESSENLKEKIKEKEKPLKKEISELRDRLTETLEANYNLSVKFLRMKNTKFFLKNRLKRLLTDHNQVMDEFKNKLTELQKEIRETVDQEFLLALTPSSKKYLQIIKYNGQLIHENLCLQLKTESLNLELDRIKMTQSKNETNNKLKYINSKNRLPRKAPSSVPTLKRTKHVEELKSDTDSDLLSSQTPLKTDRTENSSTILQVRKIYEKTQTPDTPSIIILPLDKSERVTVKEVSQLAQLCDKSSGGSASTYDLLQLSNCPSQNTEVSFYTTAGCGERPHSAPTNATARSDNT